MSLVIGVDPGGTTGLAAVEYTEEHGYRLLAHVGAPYAAKEIYDAFTALLPPRDGRPWWEDQGPWWIAAERFVVSRRAGRSASAAAGERARNILGALEAAFPGRVKLANASAAKTWATGDRLAAAGLNPTQGRPHTLDACRHALRFHVAQLGNPDPVSAAYDRHRRG